MMFVLTRLIAKLPTKFMHMRQKDFASLSGRSLIFLDTSIQLSSKEHKIACRRKNRDEWV